MLERDYVSFFIKIVRRLVELPFEVIDWSKVFIFRGSRLRYFAMRCSSGRTRKAIWKKMGHEVGSQTFINGNITILTSSHLEDRIVLGDRVATASGIIFILESSPNNSRLKDCPDVQSTLRHGSIIVGEDTWIGAGAIIHPGVIIGKHCVVGAMANVTRDVPDNSIVVGNPARIVRTIRWGNTNA